MPIQITVKPSSNSKKKYMAVIQAPGLKRTIHFGASGMSDYTINKDPKRKQRYITRHQARENWNDPLTAGFWSRWMLWEKPSLEASKTFAVNKAKRILKQKGY